jgi:transketolase
MPHNILEQGGLEKLKQEQPERFEKEIAGANYLNLQGLDLVLPDGVDVEKMKKLAKIMRGLIFCALEAGRSGHPGGSSSKVEQLLSLVLGGAMAFDPLAPKNPGRDRIVWSAGHCSPVLYGCLSLIYECLRRSGRQFSSAVVKPIFPEDLLRFRHSDGPQGHIENYYPLSDIATGASGHGLPSAGGIALVHQSCGLDTKVWTFMGDAETEEGMTYEARNILATAGNKNIIVTLDYNHFGIDGPIEEVISSPYINHWLGLGWNVIEINGHNFTEIINAQHLASVGFGNGSPTMILAHGIKGKYYGHNENKAASHGTPAKHDEYVSIMKNLGFEIKGDDGKVIQDIEIVLEQLRDDEINYVDKRLEFSAEKIKSEAHLVEKMKKDLVNRPFVNPVSIRRPEILPAELVFAEGEKVATRKATDAWFKWLMEQTAFFYIGTGDLSCSILTKKAEDVYGIINRQNPLGRGIRFGIAEQNMAMMSCALTQDVLPGSFQPVSVFSSYAVFTSMMANSVRMALIGNHLKPETKGFFIMLAAHDGPETGEDGPTHQGMYWMSLFTAYPGIKVYKPFDANETIEMLFYALEKGEPIALSVMRPDTPVIKRENGVPPAKEATNGAYVFKPFVNNGKKKVVLAISGCQTLLNTIEALPELEKILDVKIIAVTSPQLYEELRKTNPEKAQSILSDDERPLVITLHNGWPGFLYPFMLSADYSNRALGISDYLKSGNPKEVYELAKMTAGDIKEKILRAVKSGL